MQDLSMNPQKLAGQCAKLKCCLNFEIDAYAEASCQLPPKDMVLQTKDSDFYLFKTDILTRMLTYSSDKRMGSNLVTIPASRAFEIIALNKQGVKVDRLAEDVSEVVESREYIDLAEQDALTRFDKAKKKKSRHKAQRPSDNAAADSASADSDSCPRQDNRQNAPKRQDSKHRMRRQRNKEKKNDQQNQHNR